MTSSTNLRFVSTSHGSLAVEENGTTGIPVVLLHGNSSCRKVFQRQLAAPFAQCRRLVAVDLPGHGDSSDAPDPARTYTRSGLADAIAELFDVMRIREAVVVGWSLGGHVGIDLLSRFDTIRGLMITGTPPVRRGGMGEGFNTSPQYGFAGRPDLTAEDITAFADAMIGDPGASFLPAAIRRADGRFRRILFEAARAGAGSDQRLAVERSRVPTAVVNGCTDPLIKLDYLDGIAYGNLWDGRCHRLPDVGHAPFWQAPAQFNAVLERFLDDVC